MPENHPIKKQLDKVFSGKRVLKNMKTLVKAGFEERDEQVTSKIIVTKHPKFPGYIFKLYLDGKKCYKNIPEYQQWLDRCVGALLVRNYIEEHKLEHLFKAPHKWIYVLPEDSVSTQRSKVKTSILVVEDLEIMPDQLNEALWRSPILTTAILDQLYCLLETVGLWDCAKADNIPFSRDGRIAIVDTQTFHKWPVLYRRLFPVLKPSMRKYWAQLTGIPDVPY